MILDVFEEKIPRNLLTKITSKPSTQLAFHGEFS